MHLLDPNKVFARDLSLRVKQISLDPMISYYVVQQYQHRFDVFLNIYRPFEQSITYLQFIDKFIENNSPQFTNLNLNLNLNGNGNQNWLIYAFWIRHKSQLNYYLVKFKINFMTNYLIFCLYSTYSILNMFFALFSYVLYE